MGDLVEEAHCLYNKLLAYQQSRIGQQDEDGLKHIHQQRQMISALILQFICVCPPEGRFKYGEFTKIISDSSKTQYFEPEKAVQAFLCLEDYIILLYLMPWKTEYQNIKKYGGHYQTKIASHLKGAEIILSLIGFTDLTTGLMILSHHTKQDVLMYIAFECLVASAECLIISQIWRKVKNNAKLTISDVVQLRLQNSGNADAIVSVIESKFGRTVNRGQSDQLDRIERRSGKRTPLNMRDSTLFHDKLQEHINKVNKIGSSDPDNDIPYMDEDVKEIERKPENFEDHLLASLQLVDTEKAPAPCGIATKPALRASQEWSFVREGLEKNYGKKYFDGPREDILKQQQVDLAKEGGYVQMIAEPKYENGLFHKFSQPVSPTPNYGGSPCFTGDSAYQSASTMYPPKLDDPMIKRGPFHSDIILKKVPLHPSTTAQKTQTAPIMKRPPDMSKASSTFPGSQRLVNVPTHADNIRKHHKGSPSSMPIQKEPSPEMVGLSRNKHPHPQASKMAFSNVPNVLGTRTNHSSMDNVGTSTVKEQSRTPTIGKSLNAPTSVMDNISVGSNIVNQIPVIDRTTKNVLQWECAYCTYLNTSPDMVCSMCCKTRDNMEVDGPHVGKVSRVCLKCTLENSPDSSSCTACGNELRGVQTVI